MYVIQRNLSLLLQFENKSNLFNTIFLYSIDYRQSWNIWLLAMRFFLFLEKIECNIKWNKLLFKLIMVDSNKKQTNFREKTINFWKSNSTFCFLSSNEIGTKKKCFIYIFRCFNFVLAEPIDFLMKYFIYWRFSIWVYLLNV